MFAMPSPPDDCPVCMLPVPVFQPMKKYQACCGVILCMGCCAAQYGVAGPVHVEGSDHIVACPFCRDETPFADGNIADKVRKGVERGDAEACNMLGSYYDNGEFVPKDEK